jgi:hypothetical protein
MAAVRSVLVSYSPTCNSITTTGNLVIAPQVTDVSNNYATGYHLDMKTYNDIAGMPGAVKTPVVRAATFMLKPMVKPTLPSSEFIELDANSAFCSLRMLIACDTQLGVGAFDSLGELSFTIVMDCYGAQWNPTLVLSGATEAPEERKQREIDRAVKVAIEKMRLLPVEGKETKDKQTQLTSVTEDPREWEMLEQDELRRRITDQRAYKAAVSGAQKTIDSQSSSACTTSSSPPVPNGNARVQKL